MLPHGITGPPEQSLRNSENKFSLARPLMRPNFVALRQKAVRQKFALRKSIPKFTQQICHQIGRPYTSFYIQSVVTLAVYRLLRFRDVAGFE